MKLSSHRRLLADGLQAAGHAVSGRSTLPILSNVLLDAKANQLRLLASDLEIWMECMIPLSVEEEGAITVPARVLGEVVGSLPEAEVSLEADQTRLTIRSGRSEYSIQGLPADEFPAAPDVGDACTVGLKQAALRRLIRNTLFAASVDETRAILTGALMVVGKDSLKFVVTDMHRLAVDVTAAQGSAAEPKSVIVPSRALHELFRVLSGEDDPEVSVKVGESQAVFDLGDLRLVSRLIEGQFPNYERVIPAETERRLVVARDELLAAIKRAAIVARAEANKVVLRAREGMLSIEAESSDLGKAHEEVEVELEGEAVEIAFNADYLIDVLAALENESVAVSLSGPLNPGVIRPSDGGNYIYVVMPMQML